MEGGTSAKIAQHAREAHITFPKGNGKKTIKEQHEHPKHSNSPPWSKKETDAQGPKQNKMQDLDL